MSGRLEGEQPKDREPFKSFAQRIEETHRFYEKEGVGSPHLKAFGDALRYIEASTNVAHFEQELKLGRVSSGIGEPLRSRYMAAMDSAVHGREQHEEEIPDFNEKYYLPADRRIREAIKAHKAEFPKTSPLSESSPISLLRSVRSAIINRTSSFH